MAGTKEPVILFFDQQKGVNSLQYIKPIATLIALVIPWLLILHHLELTKKPHISIKELFERKGYIVPGQLPTLERLVRYHEKDYQCMDKEDWYKDAVIYWWDGYDPIPLTDDSYYRLTVWRTWLFQKQYARETLSECIGYERKETEILAETYRHENENQTNNNGANDISD